MNSYKIGDRVQSVLPITGVPVGTTGTVRGIKDGAPYPVYVDFDVEDGENWPVKLREIAYLAD